MNTHADDALTDVIAPHAYTTPCALYNNKRPVVVALLSVLVWLVFLLYKVAKDLDGKSIDLKANIQRTEVQSTST